MTRAHISHAISDPVDNLRAGQAAFRRGANRVSMRSHQSILLVLHMLFDARVTLNTPDFYLRGTAHVNETWVGFETESRDDIILTWVVAPYMDQIIAAVEALEDEGDGS